MLRILFGVIVVAGLCCASTRAEELKSAAPTYRPWTKICLGDTCFIGADVLVASGCKLAFGAALIEKTAGTKKTLRVIVPDSVDQARGVHIGVDQDQPTQRPYGPCHATLCSADIDGGTELIARLKRGRSLVLGAISANGPVRFELPLADFAAAYDGPPQPKAFEIQTEKEQSERKVQCDAD
jgi:invasion protein IalB